jgi:hypothetical protein
MKRSTWILLIIFVALAGLLFYLNRQEGASQGDPESMTETSQPVEFLFTDESGVPLGIEISDPDGEFVQIMRNEEGTWMLKQPTETVANQGMAEGAASQVTALRILSTLDLAPEYAGLVPPSYLVTVDFSSGEAFTVEIGDLTPTESGYYARMAMSDKIQVISKSGIDSLLKLLSNPPYPDISTPEPGYGH